MNECTKSTRIIVFDLDDTLYKEAEYVISAYHAVDDFVKETYNYSNAFAVLEQAFNTNKNPFDALAQAMSPTEINIPALLNIYRTHKPNLSLNRSVEITLENLAGEDAILCMITDGRSITQRNKIEALGLNKFFTDANIVISEEFGAEKTDKSPFEHIMKLYPEAKHFYYIGDNTAKDFFWPNRLRWTTICIEDNGQNIHKQNFNGDKMHNPSFLIENFYDIPTIIFE